MGSNASDRTASACIGRSGGASLLIHLSNSVVDCDCEAPKRFSPAVPFSFMVRRRTIQYSVTPVIGRDSQTQLLSLRAQPRNPAPREESGSLPHRPAGHGGHVAALAMMAKHAFAFSRHEFVRAIQLTRPRKTEGAGKAGCRPHPWPACRKKHAAEPQVSQTTGLPCAMVLTLIRDLPGVPGLLATVVHEIITRELSASVGAPGPHDFTSAPMLFVRSRNACCNIDASTASHAQRP
jgi:hypothetical protein